jgi:hypothetical protein
MRTNQLSTRRKKDTSMDSPEDPSYAYLEPVPAELALAASGRYSDLLKRSAPDLVETVRTLTVRVLSLRRRLCLGLCLLSLRLLHLRDIRIY